MSEKIAALIEEVKGLSVLELSELVHALEETFGVSAAAAAVAAPAAGAAEAAEEKTEFDVVLKECGANKHKGFPLNLPASENEPDSKIQGQIYLPTLLSFYSPDYIKPSFHRQAPSEFPVNHG